MPAITDWLMVVITAVYVVATIIICIANYKSAKEAHKQTEESIQQFNKSNRPYITCEYILSSRTYCGIHICNHGNQVARNLKINVDKEFMDLLVEGHFLKFKKINDSVYTVVGINQSYDFYFSKVKNKPVKVPLNILLKYENDEGKSYEERFVIDLGKQLPIESIKSDFEKAVKSINRQNEVLKNISNKLDKIAIELQDKKNNE